MKVKAGVVGVGAIGRNHARVYAELASAELVAIYDANHDHARALAAEFGTEAVATLEELVERVDAASVATPTVTHREVATKLLSARKHVLVEKPISDSVDDAKAMIDLAAEMGCVLQVGHIERFNPVMSRLEAVLDSPKFIECHRLSPFPQRSLDIGVVLDLMIHDLEIVLHLVSSPIATIDAVGIPVLTRREDIANARIRFENGCVANLTASRISRDKVRKIRIFQEDAYLSLNYQNQSGYILRLKEGGIKRERVKVVKGEPLQRELAAFVTCAREGIQPRVTGGEAAVALDLAIRITKQIEEADPRKKSPTLTA
jgi:predicted dehydrogenase